MKKHIIATTLALALVAPTLALACSVTDVDALFTCDGWNATIVVQFTGEVTELNVDYAVTLLDENENPLEYVADRLTIQRPQDSDTVIVELDGMWQGVYRGTGFKAAVAAEVEGSEPYGFIADLQCTVDIDGVSWDHVKSQYR